MNVRRLAALDLYGRSGTRRRKRIVLAEFVVTTVLGLALGVLILASGPSLGTGVFGVGLIGIGANYGALSVHAVALARGAALHEALAGVDTERARRDYSLRQLTLAIPFWVAAQALRQAVTSGRP
jgi:hypothetical protein